MRSRLNAILSSADFAEPERAAMVLDGEAFRVESCIAAIDELPSPLLRAKALCIELPKRLIVEQHTAAWVWGVIAHPPPMLEVCSDHTARARPAPGHRLRVREVVILHEDVAHLGGISVTTPLRTAIDLARFVTEWNLGEQHAVTELMRLGRFGALDCARVMNRRRNLPAKLVALQRLAACQVELDGGV